MAATTVDGITEYTSKDLQETATWSARQRACPEDGKPLRLKSWTVQVPREGAVFLAIVAECTRHHVTAYHNCLI